MRDGGNEFVCVMFRMKFGGSAVKSKSGVVVSFCPERTLLNPV